MTIDDLLARREGTDFEGKEAQGRDGRGAVPRSLWETYSAMANTQGGDIVLGVRERDDGSLDVLGVTEPDRVIQQFWDGVNNRQTVNANILRNADVGVVRGGGLAVVHVAVPRARRQDRPVFVGDNPFGGTYRRNHEGDYRCPSPEVRRMIADAEHDQRDARILPGYGSSDLDAESLAAYRNEFRSAIPNHVWHTEDDAGLLEQLGGWRRDRQTGEEGLTLAGLLMFGRLRPILDTLPDYVLDYREIPDDESRRWVDRVTTDGTWSGNLYGFYRRAFARLVDGLRVPFQTEAGQRVDETPVHRALKEALVNALIHADYSASTPILVEKRRGRFSFRNPGALRIPPALVRAGGNSDCRNRALQKMFQMIGAAEQAGSGYPTILGAWQGQHWRPPSLTESFSPEYVVLDLSTASLLPERILGRSRSQFGAAFDELEGPARTAVATAAIEGQVTNGRLQEILDIHPSELTQLLGSLVESGFLVPHGQGRWTRYTLAPESVGQHRLFDPLDTGHKEGDTGISGLNTAHKAGDTGHSGPGWLSPFVPMTRAVRDTDRATPADVEAALVSALQRAAELDTYLTTKDLAALLNRKVPTVRRYLKRLDDNDIETRYPGRQAPGQGYRSRPTERPAGDGRQRGRSG